MELLLQAKSAFDHINQMEFWREIKSCRATHLDEPKIEWARHWDETMVKPARINLLHAGYAFVGKCTNNKFTFRLVLNYLPEQLMNMHNICDSGPRLYRPKLKENWFRERDELADSLLLVY